MSFLSLLVRRDYFSNKISNVEAWRFFSVSLTRRNKKLSTQILWIKSFLYVCTYIYKYICIYVYKCVHIKEGRDTEGSKARRESEYNFPCVQSVGRGFRPSPNEVSVAMSRVKYIFWEGGEKKSLRENDMRTRNELKKKSLNCTECSFSPSVERMKKAAARNTGKKSVAEFRTDNILLLIAVEKGGK